jgi:hypothetical protein
VFGTYLLDSREVFMGTPGEVIKIVAGFAIVTILTILTDRWLSDKAAVFVLIVSLLIFAVLSQQEISQFRGWARGNRQIVIVGCIVVFAVLGFVVGKLITGKAFVSTAAPTLPPAPPLEHSASTLKPPIDPPKQHVLELPKPNLKVKTAPSKPIAEQGFHEKVQKYFISLGEGLSVSATVEGLKAGMSPFEGYPTRVFSQENDNDIHYEIAVWNGTRAIVVKDNEFSLGWSGLDRNYDNHTLEIVDENLGPILQVIWKTPSELVINGIFQLPGTNTVFIADSHSLRTWKPGERITALFKYPSRRFLGQYADQ